MKKTILFLLSSCFMFAACNMEKIEESVPNASETEKISFSVDASINGIDVDDTKASMVPLVRVSWKLGDKISVIDCGSKEVLGSLTATLLHDGNGYNASFSGEINEPSGNAIAYVYPAIDEGKTLNDKIDLSHQSYTTSTSVAFCGYVNASFNSSKLVAGSYTGGQIVLNLATSYLNLNLTDLTPDMEIGTVAISNINDGLKWFVENSTLVPVYPDTTNTGIEIATSTTTSHKGNAVIRFAIPASPQVTGDNHRDVVVNGVYKSTMYRSEIEANQFVDYIVSGFTVNSGNVVVNEKSTETEVTVTPSTTEATTVEGAIPAATNETTAFVENKSTVITLGSEATIEFDAAATNAIAAKAESESSDIYLKVENVTEKQSTSEYIKVYDVTMITVKNGTEVYPSSSSENQGSATITIPYTPTENTTYKVYWVKDDGTKEEIANPTYDSANGKLSFTVTHFSTYAVEETPQVAQIGTTKYATLAEAVAAATDGQTVTLIADITETEQVVVDKAITVDFNGKTLTSSVSMANQSGDDRFAVKVTAAAELKNGTILANDARGVVTRANVTITGMDVTSGHADELAVCSYAGNLTVTGGTYSGEYAALGSFASDQEFVINNATLNGGIYHNGSYKDFKLTIDGSTITSGNTSDAAIYISGQKVYTDLGQTEHVKCHDVTIKNSTITGKTAVEVKFADVKFENCTVTATGELTYDKNNNGSTSSGFAVVSTDNSMGTESASLNGTITIDGGKYKGAIGLKSIATTEPEANYVISSGIFSAAPANDYLKNGYQVVDNTDTETMTVYPKKVVANASSTVATTAELQAALDAATENAIIECASGTYDMVYFRQTLNKSTRRSDLDKDSSYPAYYRKFESITIKAAEGATVTCKGIKAEAGLFWYSSAPASNQAGMNKATGGFVSYLALENITIDGIRFDASANSSIILRDNGAVSTRSNIMVDGLTIQNCTATGDATNNNIHFFSAGAGTNDQNFPGTEKKAFNNITIKGNSLTSFVQPICFNNNTAVVNSMAITGNTFTNCEDNQLQVSNKVNAGTWTISGNTFVGLNGRLIRMTNAQATATIRFENNVITTPRGYDTGGDGSIVKITGVNGFAVIENNNGWAAGAYTSEAKTTWISNGTMVAQIGDTKYPTLAAALIAAESGATIEILSGTWGAEAIGKLDPAGSYTNANKVRYKSLTIQPAEGATVKFTSNVSLGYDDSSTANATMTVKGLTFSGASLMLSNYVQNTVEDCTFTNGTSSTAGVLIVQDACCKNHKTTDTYPASQITIKNCSIDGSNDGASGMRLRNSGNVTIEGCTIKNSKFNGILFESNGSVDNTAAKTINIKNNTITEWNSTNKADNGRAMRLALGTLASGSTVTVSGNIMHKEALGLDTPDFLKATGCGSASVDISGNYWSNKTLSEVKDKSDVYTSDVTATITSVITTK